MITLNNNILELDLSVTNKMILAMYNHPIDEVVKTLQLSKRSIQRGRKEIKLKYPDFIENDKYVAPPQLTKSVAITQNDKYVAPIENDKSVAIDLELQEMIKNIIPPDWKNIGWNDESGFHYKDEVNNNTAPD